MSDRIAECLATMVLPAFRGLGYLKKDRMDRLPSTDIASETFGNAAATRL